MRLISWNVNGFQSIMKKGFLDFVKEHDSDILCLQETRCDSTKTEIGDRLSAPKANPSPISRYGRYWNDATRPGYSGTAIFTKIKPLKVTKGLSIEGHDTEGRVLTAEYEDFFLANVYTPNSKRDLSRLGYRQKEWDVDFLAYLKKLEKTKPVIFCGDLNVAHKEIDLANPKANRKNHGFTDEERAGFDNLIKAGFLDTFREFTDEGGHYTWWSRLFNARRRNIGWRIDYFLISPALRPRLMDAFILKDVVGSDHCPVGIVLK